jgi:protein TonB
VFSGKQREPGANDAPLVPRERPRGVEEHPVVVAKSATEANTGEPATGSSESPASLAYAERVRLAIERQKFYPRAARLKRIQGRVLVAFVIAGDGSVSEIRTVGRTPAAELANAAEAAVRAVGSFEPIPAELGRTRLKFEIPVVFSMD